MNFYSFEEKTENDSFIRDIRATAASFYPTQDLWGYEIWQKDSSTDIHLDKDETLYERRGILSFPVCSVIFYYEVSDDIEGGELYSPNDWVVFPKQNRLVIFGPAIRHGVSDFTGIRKSVLVNFWEYRLGTIPKNIP